MTMRGTGRLGILGAAAVLLTTAGCLGQDYRDVELALSDWDHGWLAVVEPGEPFSVGLLEHPQHPGEPWVIEAAGDPVLAVTGPTVDRPEDAPEEEREQAFLVFDVTARDVGEAPLSFLLAVDGSTVDRIELQVSVLADACESDEGIAAPRCGGPQQVTAPQAAAPRCCPNASTAARSRSPRARSSR